MELRVGDEFVGKGLRPEHAAITAICGGQIHMVRWKPAAKGSKRMPTKTPFVLPERFFRSRACGWVRISKN